MIEHRRRLTPCRAAQAGAILAVVTLTSPPLLDAASSLFRRGDCNDDAAFDLSDPIFTLAYLFTAGEAPHCSDACDVNDDGSLDVSDVVFHLAALFTGGPPPAPPHAACGSDWSEDALPCASSLACADAGLILSAGDATATAATLWVASDAPGTVTVIVGEDPELSSTIASVTLDVADPLVPSKASLDGLAAGGEYFTLATPPSGPAVLGRFRTPPAAGAPHGLRFGVSGDWRGELAPYPAIANAPERDLDLFIALGDTIYADFPSPEVPLLQAETLEEFRLKHREVYDEPSSPQPLRALRSSCAWLATIDDHEVTNDFAGGAPPASDPRFAFTSEEFINETPLFLNGVQAFAEYHPIADELYATPSDPRTDGKRKLYRTRTYGDDAALFLLDARSFRDAMLPPILDPLDLIAIAAFLADAFTPGRTLLGAAQLADLEADLLAAQDAGITWKFVLVPEPIQNLGFALAWDRFEGYAAERSELLAFIADNAITNVVFVSADIHGTVVNDLSYQLEFLGPQLPVPGAFEITTGPVAYDAPFGPTIAQLAIDAGLIPPDVAALYTDVWGMDERDDFVAGLVDEQLALLGYDLLGLDGSTVDFELLEGQLTRTHVYGWSEFEIDPTTQALTVTTFGIEPYTEADLTSDPAVLARVPEIVSRFIVQPQ